MSHDQVTFPENPPTGVVLLRGIHGGYSIISISEPSGRPLYATQDLTDALAWMGAAFSSEGEEDMDEDEEDEATQEIERMEQRYKLPDMGSVGRTTPYQPANTCIKPGCALGPNQRCVDPGCPFNFRNVPQDMNVEPVL